MVAEAVRTQATGTRSGHPRRKCFFCGLCVRFIRQTEHMEGVFRRESRREQGGRGAEESFLLLQYILRYGRVLYDAVVNVKEVGGGGVALG